MKAESKPLASPFRRSEVSLMEPSRSSAPARHWRLSIPVSLGVILLLTSLVIAAVSIRSHAGDGSATPTTAPASFNPTADQPWMSLGSVDTERGVTPLYPLQLGRVLRIAAHENETVKKGTPLFYLDDSVQKLKVDQAEADLDASKQKLAVAQARVKQLDAQIEAQKDAVAAAQVAAERAQTPVDKKKELQEKKLATAEEVKDAELLLKQAKIGVKAERGKLAAFVAGREQAAGAVELAKADIKAKEAQLKEAQKAVDECVLRAPVDGTPLRILVGEGQTLGSNPRKAAVEFLADAPLLVRAEVEQEFAGRIRIGESVVIQDHVTGQPCAKGKVLSVARWYAHRRSASPEMMGLNNDARTLECIVQIDSTSQEVRMGQRVRVHFSR